MKRILVFAMISVMLLFHMTACSFSFEVPGLKGQSSEASASAAASEPATPKPTTEPTPEPTPKTTPTPSPTPLPQHITSYEQLSAQAQSELETMAWNVLDGHFQSNAAMEGSFQVRMSTGPGGPLPKAEDFVSFEADLDSVYVLTARESGEGPANRVVYLYEIHTVFDGENVSDFYNHLEFYFAVSAENVAVDGSGTLSFRADDMRIQQIVDPKFYDFYDIYEEAVLSGTDRYEIAETVVSDHHADRMSSRVMEKYLSIIADPKWAGWYDFRHMIEADVRGIDAEHLQELRDRYYEHIETVRLEKNYDTWKDNLEYNLNFLEEHLKKAAELMPEAPSEPASASNNETEKDPEAYWEEFLRSEYQQYLSGHSLSELEYVIADVSEDGRPELMIQSTVERPFYTTWLFALDQGKATLVDERYGYGMYRYDAEKGLLVISPTTKPFRGAGEYPFYRLEGIQLTEAFGVGENLDGYYYRDEAGLTMLSKEERDAYFMDLTSFEWQTLAGSAEEPESAPPENIEPAFDPVGIWKIDSYKMAENTDTVGYEVGSGATLMLMENGNITFDDKAGASFYGSWKPYDESRLYAKLKNRETEQEMVVYLWEEEASTGRKGIALEIEESGAILYWKWFV